MNLLETVNIWANAWTSWIISSLVQTFVVLLCVWLISLVFRRWMTPSVLCGLFLLVLIKLMIPYEVSVPNWISRVSVQHQLPRMLERFTLENQHLEEDRTHPDALKVQSDGPAADIPVTMPVAQDASLTLETDHQAAGTTSSFGPSAASVEMVSLSGAAINRNAQMPKQTADAEVVRVTQIGRESDVAVPDTDRLTPAAWLMVVWAAMVAVLLTLFARMQWKLFRLAGQSVPAEADQNPVDVAALCRQAGITRSIRVAHSEGISSPAVCGLFRPMLLLPVDLQKHLTRTQMEWVIQHELAHLLRGDLWIIVFQRILQIVQFFNPSVWIANRVINRQREYACDDFALAACEASTRKMCGSAFLAVVEFANQVPKPAAGLLGMAARKSLYRSRLMRILDGNRLIATRRTWRTTALVVAVALLVLPNLRANQNGEKVATESTVDSVDKSATGQPKTYETATEAEPKTGSFKQPGQKDDVTETTDARPLVDAVLKRATAIKSGRFVYRSHVSARKVRESKSGDRQSQASVSGYRVNAFGNHLRTNRTTELPAARGAGRGRKGYDSADERLTASWLQTWRKNLTGPGARGPKSADKAYRFSIDGEKWILRNPGSLKTTLNSDGRLMVLTGDTSDYAISAEQPANAQLKLNFAGYSPPTNVSKTLVVKYPESPQMSHMAVLNAGTIWFESTREFIALYADDARVSQQEIATLVPQQVDVAPSTTTVEFRQAQVLEWKVAPDEIEQAFGMTNDLLKSGGILRLWVLPQLGNAIARIEYIDAFDTVQTQFHFHLFKEIVDGIHFPSGVTIETGAQQLAYVVDSVELINQEIPAEDQSKRRQRHVRGFEEEWKTRTWSQQRWRFWSEEEVGSYRREVPVSSLHDRRPLSQRLPPKAAAGNGP
jgi:beta-lactamase regulating signal transducer with metallopeptidase domain